ncbi:MAG: N,N-dimethylformamidase beta subunit family domain-containing protein [Burkholderiaceae bacterium]
MSIRPGQTIRFHASSHVAEPINARIARVICADPNPDGPGIQLGAPEVSLKALQAAKPEVVPTGSYGLARGVGDYLTECSPQSLTIVCRVRPTLTGKKQMILALTKGGQEDSGVWLSLEADGRLKATVRVKESFVAVQLNDMPLHAWSQIALSFDADEHQVTLSRFICLPDAPGVHAADAKVDTASGDAIDWAGARLVLAASVEPGPSGVVSHHFNGRLEAPMLFDQVLAMPDLQSLADSSQKAPNPDAGSNRPLLDWRFSEHMQSQKIPASGGNQAPLQLVNAPVRAVAGSRWNGRVMHYAEAPEQYGAIHFHEDDLADCLWPVVYEWTVPQDTRSGIYALFLKAGEHEDNVPFHVVPAPGKARAKVAVLASTYTYTVYGNNARPEWDADPQWQQRWRDQAAQWQGYPYNPGDHREYGLSTYNLHPDNSGVSLVTWLRPMLNVRVGYVTFPDPQIRGSGLRHFPADTHLTAWLEHAGIDYDIITDVELDQEGIDLLGQYQVVLTGSHPEYHTREMLTALQMFRDQGGRFCYLGGNGFYWKIAKSDELPGVIEIRRGEGGIRAWASEPGEYYNQLDGEYGGLWRRNGRPPQQLCGVGFSAQGNFSGSYYRLTDAAQDARVSWMFDGIEGPIIGQHGLSAHGAAGFELDRADEELGTPAEAIVVARSENHPPEAPWILVPEEMLTHLLTLPRQPAQSLVRADMTFFPVAGGGAVFSTGSITFCGSLPSNGFDNDIARLMSNVVNRFLDPTPFEA